MYHVGDCPTGAVSRTRNGRRRNVTGDEKGNVGRRTGTGSANFYRAVLDGARAATLVCDPSGTVLWSNAALLAMLSSDHVLVGAVLMDLVHPDERHAVTAVFAQVTAAEGTDGYAETRIRDARGEWR
jgi:PAS domain S-box-containing protein